MIEVYTEKRQYATHTKQKYTKSTHVLQKEDTRTCTSAELLQTNTQNVESNLQESIVHALTNEYCKKTCIQSLHTIDINLLYIFILHTKYTTRWNHTSME